MNYRTLWAYLRFEERVNNHVIIPQIVLDACVGKGEGSRLLSEEEGEVLEVLISGEQGGMPIETIRDLQKFFYQDSNSIEDILKNLQNKGYIRFLDNFFV